MKVLITGGTGFIGKRFVDSIKNQVDHIYLLTRSYKLNQSKKLFKDIENLTFIAGDISNSDIFESVNDLNTVIENVDTCIHIAALYNLESTAFDSYKANVCGTQNLIQLCKYINNLNFFHYISSYAVNQGHNKEYLEEEINNVNNLNDNYSKSKLYTEEYLRNLNEEFKIRIYRPGIIIGDSKTGEIDKVDGPYYFIKHLKKHLDKYKLANDRYLPFPILPETNFPVVPVDYLISWLNKMILSPVGKDALRTYHLTPESPPRMKHFLELLLKAFKVNTQIIPVGYFNPNKLLSTIGLPKEISSFMVSKSNYSIKNRTNDFPDLEKINFDDCLPIIFEKSINQVDVK